MACDMIIIVKAALDTAQQCSAAAKGGRSRGERVKRQSVQPLSHALPAAQDEPGSSVN